MIYKELIIKNNDGLKAKAAASFVPVSYTHMTLPTNREDELQGVAG